MELYTSTSYELSRILTARYSTSFNKSSQLFAPSIRQHVFAIYGLVRIADEIVDTYQERNSLQLLDELEQTVYRAITSGYDANPIVHAFADTYRKFAIDTALIKAFFASMRTDLTRKTFSQKEYETYIYGSAEVIGLMCLKIFVNGDNAEYQHLEPGAKVLGAAYQKVNFLRDIASDFHDRGRVYFPGVDFHQFNEADKRAIEEDIEADFHAARGAIEQLPRGARRAVRLSFEYYYELLQIIKKTPAKTLTTSRVRVPTMKKLLLRVTPKGSR